MIDLKKIATEQRNEASMDLDKMSALEIVTLINKEDHKIAEAINDKIQEIGDVVKVAGDAIANGGRIIYIGAGTSGRLGVLDAVECPPTYGVDFNTVLGLMAGGEEAFIKAQEGAEDSEDFAIEDLKNANLTDKDLVVGVAASGRTPYVIGGLKYAKSVGAKTSSVAITFNSEVAKYADFPIEVQVGSEVVTGSTRMKAGTAQKMILNMISTGAMILNGKVYQNLMVDVQQTNLKLVERAKNIVMQATDCSYDVASETLLVADGHAKTAIVMILNQIDLESAKTLLEKNNGFIR